MGGSFDNLDISTAQSVTTISVDRVDTRNSLNIETLTELSTALDAAMDDPETSVLVLTGGGDEAFVSGADIGDFHGQDSLWFIRDFRRAFREVEEAIEGGPKPVIAALDGITFGGGLELALMCDLVYASDASALGFPESKLGGIPGVGGTQRLALIVGYLKAKELVLTGRTVMPEEAASLGIVNDVFPDEEFDDRVYDIARDLATGAPYAQWFGKEVINQTREGLEKGLALEAALGAVLFETDDIHEGFRAFLEQRNPDFSDWSEF
ncbi:enoyl-CoA hydratase/isomerase family protein [Halomarina halobia]|uniref:Enoyl-CoA hydratase/isomerase family protein n=1 Tax=Halomarina halobia TaxID=3033386 RepID=A0ABD6AEW8_9EURY|nr:enoyl-CoA hydratase-related protein [Halomarina sp. PSR21]